MWSSLGCPRPQHQPIKLLASGVKYKCQIGPHNWARPRRIREMPQLGPVFVGDDDKPAAAVSRQSHEALHLRVMKRIMVGQLTHHHIGKAVVADRKGVV